VPKEPSVVELETERCAILDLALSGTASESWPRVRQILVESPSLFTDRHIYTIWEGPTRGLLLPLPFEALREFVRRHRGEATQHLVVALEDSDPNLVGYALHALSQITSEHMPTYAATVAGRTETIHAIYGSFGWEGTLAQYAVHLQDDA
jgi:hypothetical protein